MSMTSHLSVGRRIRGGSFGSDTCSAASRVRTISIFVPCIVLWPKDVAAVGARGIGVAGVGAARMQHASTQCASPPVPHEPPRPAHAHKSTCAGSGPMRTALCCFHRAHRNTMRGSYTGAGIHGHWPAPKTSRKPTPACMYKHGKSARVRWPCVPIGGVCAHTGDSDEGWALLSEMIVIWVFLFSDIRGNNILKILLVESKLNWN